MPNIDQHLDRFASLLARRVIQYRWLVIATAIILTFSAATGMRLLEFSTNYRVFFSQENPELIAYEAFQNTYTKNDNFLFILQPKDGEIFNPQMASAVETLTEKAWQIPFSIRVDSISNFQHSRADGDNLIVEDLISDATARSQAELDYAKAVALAEPLLHNNLISADADTTGINVTIQYPEKSIQEVPETVAVVRQIAQDLQAQYPDVHIALSGFSMLNNAFAEAGKSDASTLIPAMYLTLLVLIIVILRSISSTIATLFVIGFSTLIAMGLAGYAGIKLTPVSVTAPTIILTLAIADSVHVLVSMLSAIRQGATKYDAIVDSIRINFTPISITSLTTIVGFLSLNFSDAPPFWHLGNITAMGITAAWLLSLTFLPAVLSLLPIKQQTQKKASILNRALEQLAEFVIRKRRQVLIVMGSISIILMALAPTIELNDQFVEYFDHSIQFRNDAEFGIEHLNGIYVAEFSLESGEAGGISNPEYLHNLEKFTAWLREQPEVRHVFSYSDIIKRLNKNMHGDDASWYRIPEERNLAAQYLLLYELSLPYGLDLNDRINIDKSSSRVSATLDNLSTLEGRAFFDRASQWLRSNTPDYMWTQPTSAAVMFTYISKRNIESMLGGNAFAIIAIALILAIALRNIRLGIFSLIPNAAPILMTYGAWALLVGQVGMAAATVTATSLGIVVDDTVHFLSKYLRARNEKGLSAEDAIRYTFVTVGPAIVSTTIILTVGFAVLTASSFLINFQMGLLTAFAIVLALLFDFLILPTLLMLGSKKSNRGENYATQLVSENN